MPIQIQGRVVPTGETEDFGLLSPGEIMHLPDYTFVGSRVLAIYCYPGDNGGELYSFPALTGEPGRDDPLADPDLQARLIRTSGLGGQHLIRTLDVAGQYAHPIKTPDGLAAHLYVSHVASRASHAA